MSQVGAGRSAPGMDDRARQARAPPAGPAPSPGKGGARGQGGSSPPGRRDDPYSQSQQQDPYGQQVPNYPQYGQMAMYPSAGGSSGLVAGQYFPYAPIMMMPAYGYAAQPSYGQQYGHYSGGGGQDSQQAYMQMMAQMQPQGGSDHTVRS